MDYANTRLCMLQQNPGVAANSGGTAVHQFDGCSPTDRAQERSLAFQHGKLLSLLSSGLCSSQGNTRNDDFHACITFTELLAVSEKIFQSELWVMPFAVHSSSSQAS